MLSRVPAPLAALFAARQALEALRTAARQRLIDLAVGVRRP